MAISDSYKRLLAPAIANEALQEAKAKADTNSIQVFANNLSQLLLAPPLGENASWPSIRDFAAVVKWFASMKKAICSTMKPFIRMRRKRNHGAQKVRSMVNSYKIDAIAIGSGTASRETEFFIKKIAFDKPVQVFV
jgi:uncharacterized protein